MFPDSKVHGITTTPDGSVTVAELELAGQQFKGINGGPQFPFTEAVSFYVECEGQDEVDHYWDALLAGGGTESRCGWLKDRFGLSWQIVPVECMEMLTTGTPEQVGRYMSALMEMGKLDLAALQAAWNG